MNLLPFVQSFVNRDAPEIDHEEIIWNLTTELIGRVDKVFDKVQSRVKAGLDAGDVITSDVVEMVDTLRTLRHFAREVARREEITLAVKGQGQENTKEEHNFGMLVDDIDMSLHEFRYRNSRTVPLFKQRRKKTLTNTLSGASSGRTDVIKRDVSKFQHGSNPVVVFNTSLENNYMSLVNADISKNFPNASKMKVGESLIGELVPGEFIYVKLEQKHVKAEVVEMLPQMKAAYLSFEDYPSLYDEYQPYDFLRLPNMAEIPAEDVKDGLVVIDLSNSNEYRATVQSTWDGPMARVKMIVSQHEMTRIISPSMILGRWAPLKKKVKQPIKRSLVELVEDAPPVVRPSKIGNIVEVGRRGSARVIGVHGEPATHVDVRFILGSAHTEKMIPIEEVALAPELDPELGRSSRKKATEPEVEARKGANGKENDLAVSVPPGVSEVQVLSPSTASNTDLSD